MTGSAALTEILDAARWAPSGDNTQPWRFEILSDNHVVVHGFDTRETCVYDLDGRASQLSIGALLETLRIAATHHRLRTEFVRRISCPESRPTYDVRLVQDETVTPSNLIPYIKVRSVQRRPFRTRVLTANEKAALEAAAGAEHEIIWFEGWMSRIAMARLLWANAEIRLTIPEAFEVHRRVIEWGARFSEDRIPDQALGLDPISTRLTRWLLRDWRRVELFNTFLGGTVYPRVKLDVIPALGCAAHFLLLRKAPSSELDDVVGSGAVMQRLWLTSTKLGLQQQPEITPLIFARYAREARPFTSVLAARRRAPRLASRLAALVGNNRLERAVWMARIGAGRPAASRSLRIPMHRLTVDSRQNARAGDPLVERRP